MLSHCAPDGNTARFSPEWLGRWAELFVDNLDAYAVFAIDLSGTLLTWQPGVKTVLGYDADAFIGQPATMIFTDSDRRAGVPERELSDALQSGQANDERWHVCADGKRFWGSGVMIALRDEAGVAVGFAKLVRDRTAEHLRGELTGLRTVQLEDDVAVRKLQVQTLAEDLTRAEQRERQRISELLHDELQQQLYALQMMVHSLQGGVSALSSEQLSAELSDIYALTKSSFMMTRTLVSELSPIALRQGDFGKALTWLAEHMRQRHNLKVALSGAESCPTFSEALNVLLFQCVQELLFNVVKHAQVGAADVAVGPRSQPFRLVVSDSGQGFAVRPAEGGLPRLEGFGLQSVQQRLEPFGGTVNIASVPNKGTQVTIELPLH